MEAIAASFKPVPPVFPMSRPRTRLSVARFTALSPASPSVSTGAVPPVAGSVRLKVGTVRLLMFAIVSPAAWPIKI